MPQNYSKFLEQPNICSNFLEKKFKYSKLAMASLDISVFINVLQCSGN